MSALGSNESLYGKKYYNSFSRPDADTDVFFFPGQIIKGYQSRRHALHGNKDRNFDYYRILEMHDGSMASVMLLNESSNVDEERSGKINKSTLSGTWGLVALNQKSYMPISIPVFSNNDKRPLKNKNRNSNDLMLAYDPSEGVDEFIKSEYLIEYKGIECNITGIFTSYYNELYYLINLPGLLDAYAMGSMKALPCKLVNENDDEVKLIQKTTKQQAESSDSANDKQTPTKSKIGYLELRVKKVEDRLEHIEHELREDAKHDDTGKRKKDIAAAAESFHLLNLRF